MRCLRYLLLLLSLFLSLPVMAAKETAAQSPLPLVPLKVGAVHIQVELAKTPRQRERGLMLRKTLPKDGGMLFDFGAPARVCMWMKNTLIPLSVAFIDQDGVITNVEDMVPQTTESHCSRGWVRYALEMNKGWFARRKIKPGGKVEGLDKLPDPTRLP
ncbi:MAG: DUF192 domain-containing protein [Burkholderiaceae bacterium]|jgi:uncharacterized membrane protein (UPF0127 family)|nr:DUF192 domain-containing protein [Burkholderiaceae bacterium]